MDKLQRSSSLHKIVSTTNEIIDTVNASMSILKTLDNNSLGEQIEYTATQNAEVTGEVFTVKIPGLYTIKTTGIGVTSVLIQRNGESKVSKTILVYTDQESEEILLTSNDKLLFYVNSLRDSYTTSLVLTKGLFSLTQEVIMTADANTRLLEDLKTKISNSIDAYSKEYERLSNSNLELRKFAEEQLTKMNNTIQELSNKVNKK